MRQKNCATSPGLYAALDQNPTCWQIKVIYMSLVMTVTDKQINEQLQLFKYLKRKLVTVMTVTLNPSRPRPWHTEILIFAFDV